jgi:hypothetical protein
VPRLSYEDLREAADRFLAEHGVAVQVPVPIEEIVEFGLGINIIPLPGLHVSHEIDGFLSADMTEISVDLHVFESFPTRYRFTLAHEAGHLVLHGEVLKAAAPASIADWRKFVRELAQPDREWLEWQAYAFAGLVLVPRDSLDRAYRAAKQAADEAGFDLDRNLEVAKQYVATSIGKVFAVSAAVVEKRLGYDGIWER